MKTKGLDRKTSILNDKLKRAREQRGWTQSDVANNLGILDSNMVSRWESGVHLPSPYYRQKLSALFNMKMEELGLIKATVQIAALAPISVSDKPHSISRYAIPYSAPPVIGRDQEIAYICELLQRSSVHLVTLLGTGGSGKTCLAMKIAARMDKPFSDGVCFISLSAAKEPDHVLQAIISNLKIHKSKKLSLLEQIKRFLHEKNILLILDNFEQVMKAAPLLEMLINFCPRLKVLVTSREALCLQTGRHVVVPPLPLPNLAHVSEPDALMQYPSAALFIHYAQARLQSFQVTNENVRTIAELCIRLDGLPLAIQLAAPLIKLLSPHELLTRLSQRLIILKSDMPTIPERHQMMYSTIKWSYDLLNTQEQWLFRQLAIFAGGASLETIEHLFGTGEQSMSNITDCVCSLIDKSLLESKKLEHDTLRIIMLETTRDFAISCLREKDELEKTSSLHATYYLDMIEDTVPYLKGPQQDMHLQMLKREQVNLCNALEWLIAHKETVLVLRFSEAFGKFCGLCGYWSEEQRWLQSALKLPQTPESKAIRARVLRRAGHLEYRFRNLTTAYTLQEESVAISRDLEDRQNLAGALSGLGWVLYRQNKIDDAGLLLQESVETARISGDAWTIANTLESWGRFTYYQGKKSEAYACLQESAAIARGLQDKETAVRILKTLVIMEIELRHDSQAIVFARESLYLARKLGTRPLTALAYDTLGEFALFRGKYEQAKRFFQKSIVLACDLHDEYAVASRQLKLVNIALFQKDTQMICAFLRESRKLFRNSYDIPEMKFIQERCQKYLEEEKGENLPLQ